MLLPSLKTEKALKAQNKPIKLKSAFMGRHGRKYDGKLVNITKSLHLSDSGYTLPQINWVLSLRGGKQKQRKNMMKGKK